MLSVREREGAVAGLRVFCLCLFGLCVFLGLFLGEVGGFGIGRSMEREKIYILEIWFFGRKGLKDRKLKFVCYFYEPLGVFLGSFFFQLLSTSWIVFLGF